MDEPPPASHPFRISAFGDDALGDDDAVALARRLREREVSAAELIAAAGARSAAVAELRAVVFDAGDRFRPGLPDAALSGVPTFVKDNTDVAGMPSGHGSEAFLARPRHRDGRYTGQLLGTGLTVLGKSRLPEFGFNASTEFRTGEPVHNPWNPEYSSGASSGGAAALVASGVVPLAHANDGGGSIRIPAAACGLVGLKPTRGRHLDGEQARSLPLNVVSEGVVTRTVRDTAAYLAAAEDVWRNPALPPIGQVDGPARRRLRIGLVLDSVVGPGTDQPTRAAVEETARLIERMGHTVEPIDPPVDRQFVDDFTLYWGLLAALASATGPVLHERPFDRSKLDGLSRGLAGHLRRHLAKLPGAMRRLRRVPARYAELSRRHELVLSPVLAHTTPRLGHLSPNVPFDELLQRLHAYVSFTPLNNVAGSPAISLPLGMTPEGLPIGVQLNAAAGDERTLLEVAYALEEAQPFPRLGPAQVVSPAGSRSR